MKTTSRKILRAFMVGVLGFSLVAGTAVACGSDDDEMITTSEYEDCDTEDQNKKEDDCGYWQKGSEVRMGAQPDMTWLWIWYTWVIVGQHSLAPRGWQPPRGVTPPMRTVRVPKSKVCAMAFAAPAPPRPPAPAPRVNNPAPKAPAPKAPPAGGNRNPAPNRPRGC